MSLLFGIIFFFAVGMENIFAFITNSKFFFDWIEWNNEQNWKWQFFMIHEMFELPEVIIKKIDLQFIQSVGKCEV